MSTQYIDYPDTSSGGGGGGGSGITTLTGDVSASGTGTVPATVNYQNPATGSVARTVKAWISDRAISVKDFGAKGDGVTDDTAAIQAAAAAVVSQAGGTLYFPPGTYQTSSGITLNVSNLRILGEGAVINTTYNGQLFSLGGTGTGSRMTDILVEGLTLNASTVGTGGQQGIQLNYVRRAAVRNCVFTNFGGCGVKANEDCQYIVVEKCTADNIGTIGLYVEGSTTNPNSHIWFLNNRVTNFNYGIEAKMASHLFILGNHVETGQAGSVKYGILVTRDYSTGAEPTPQNVIVANNIVKDAAYQGINLTAVADYEVRGNIVSGSGNEGITCSGSRGICANNIVKYCTTGISVNYNANVAGGSAGVSATDYDTAQATVIGNIVFGTTSGESFSFNVCNESLIADNTVTDPGFAGYAYHFTTCTNTQVRSNVARDGSMTYAYRVEADSTGIAFRDNIASGYATGHTSDPGTLVTQGIAQMDANGDFGAASTTGSGAVVLAGAPTLTSTLIINGKFGNAGSLGSNGMMKMSGNTLSGTTQVNIDATTFTATSAATSRVDGIRSGPTTAAATFTCSVMTSFYSQNITKGTGSTITTRIAYLADAPTGGTNMAILADNTSFSGTYFINQSGTSPSVLNGSLSLPSAGLLINGSSSGTVSVLPGAAAAGTYNFNLPTTAGSAGQMLVSGGGGSNPMTWATLNATAKTANYTLTSSDYAIKVDNTAGAFTITMPSPSATPSKQYVITNVGTGTSLVTISPNSTEVFQGKKSSTYTALHLSTPGETWTLMSDGTNWIVLEHDCDTEPKAFTMAVTGATSGSVTFGTTGFNTAYYWRRGKFMHIKWGINQTAAGTDTTSGTLLFSVPDFLIDTTVHPASTTGYAACGNTISAFSGWFNGADPCSVYSSSKLCVMSAGTPTTSGTGPHFAIAGQMYLEAVVPIASWEA